MARCSRCDGTGHVYKHENCHHSHPYEQYINGCNELKQCPKCHGFGTSGIELVKGILLEIKQSGDVKSIRLAIQALKEWEKISSPTKNKEAHVEAEA